jgi:gamma-glutamylcyclotransferase (GGCT)/AIG2-like uncharacterized protein YtfP
MDAETPIPLFVYGTLMRGQANHHFLAGSRFGGAWRMPGLMLHDLGPFPMAVATTDTAADSVQGELWWIDAACLARVDRLEGHPRLYERRQLPLEGGQRAWVYLGRPRQVRHSPLLPDGRWPRRPDPSAAASALVIALLLSTGLLPAPAQAEPQGCRAWSGSHGPERIRLGNSLGEAHFLTKDRRLATSPENEPVNLYRQSDLRRLCDGR